jgi:hypothetical protein
MKKKKVNFKTLVFSFLFLSIISTNAQSKNYQMLKEINTSVWVNFYKAFSDLNYKYMSEIHSKNLVRVSGGKRILGYSEYIDNYKKSFEASRKTNQTSTINLRFFERIYSEKRASERGIYKLTRNKGTNKEKSYYGKFHIILIKEDKMWQILVDYDSNENNTIGEKQFLKAFDINDFSNY